MSYRFVRTLQMLTSIWLLLGLTGWTAPMIKPAQAATITVINTNDKGSGSLRQAIADANPGDTITFAAQVSGTITLTTGQLVISRGLLIAGPGAANLTVSGSNTSRVISVTAGTKVTIAGLTIAYGKDNDIGGAGIANNGSLTLANSVVFSNTSDIGNVSQGYGGAIYNQGTLTLTNSVVYANASVDNRWFPPAPPLVGGLDNTGTAVVIDSQVYNNFPSGVHNRGVLTLANSQVHGNGTGAHNTSTGALTVIDSLIYDNVGAGLVNAGDLVVTGSRVHDNANGISNQGLLSVTGSAINANRNGGVANNGAAILTNTDVLSNGVAGQGQGGGIYNLGITRTGTLSLINSRVGFNTALVGGGIYNDKDGHLTVTQSQVFGNTGGGLYNYNCCPYNNDWINTIVLITSSQIYGNDAGLVSIYGTVVLDASAVYNNHSTGVYVYGPNGGEIRNTTISGNADGGLWTTGITLTNATLAYNLNYGISGSPENVVIRNSILANNGNNNCKGFSQPVTLLSAGHNLSSDTSCSLTATGDLTNTEALLEALANNGGDTLTHALLPGSPAIDAGNPGLPGTGGNSCEANDQRGIPRPQNGRCDMGAFEFVPSVNLSAAVYLVRKDASAVTLAVILDSTPAVTDTVDYGTIDGTAIAGQDYIMTTGTLTFTPGTQLQTFDVPILNNPVNTASRAFDVALNNPVGVTLGLTNSATVIVAAQIFELHLPILRR